jgi:hypothetical protein
VINNYSLNNRAKPLVNELNRRGINNRLRDNVGWYDLSDQTFKGRCVEELKSIYRNCSFDNSNGGGYYYVYEDGKVNHRCGVASALLYFKGIHNECNEDYIDLRELSIDEIPDTLTRLEDRGYLDSCNFCPSCSPETRILKAAEDQLGKSEINNKKRFFRFPFFRRR